MDEIFPTRHPSISSVQNVLLSLVILISLTVTAPLSLFDLSATLKTHMSNCTFSGPVKSLSLPSVLLLSLTLAVNLAHGSQQ